jgi:hypothetical protein
MTLQSGAGPIPMASKCFLTYAWSIQTINVVFGISPPA